DFLNNLEKPIIYIAKQNKSFIGSVAVYDDLSLTFNLNAYQTATFKIYRDINGEHQKYFNDFTENRLIMIQGIGWYKIHVETDIENTGISKTINATSLECVLGYKRLINFQVNSEDLESDDDADDKYAGTIFYNPGDPNKSLLNRVLNVAPSWSVGHVDSSLANKQLTFDIDDTDVYSFLTGDVSEAFNCLFIFDTFNQTVSAYDLDNYGEDTSIYVSMDNLAQSMTESIDENSIITCYWVTRNDDVDISEVNPNGTRKIYNFEYFLPQMSEGLQSKVSEYNKKYQSLKPNYEAIVVEMQTYLEKHQELLTRNPESATSEDWTLYGLYMLQDRRDSYKAIDETYCAQGMNQPSSIQYQSYLNNKKRLDDVNAEIVVRQSELNKVQADYEVVYQQLKNIQSELDMDKWFTKDDWLELDSYVIEETYSNDNFSIADNTDDSELFSVEKELYDAAWKDLSKKCRPQYQYSSTLSNVLTIPQFKGFLKYFQLGNFIRMATDYDTVIKMRLISFTVDYNDTSKIDVTFSDAIRVHDIYDDASSIQAQANSAAMSFQFNKDQYDKSSKQSNWVAEMRKYGLDVATVQIHNASNQSQTWDKTGMTFRMWNDQRNDFDPEQIKIINNQIVFSDDGFKSSKMAIGKIPIDKNGNTVYAVNAEAILGKLFLGEYLTLQNNSGTYKFDDAGFIASSGKNSVKIQPNQSGELFSICKGNNKQFYVDSDGNVHFKGDLTGSSGTFSGNISGGSINIGNGTFTVDKNGNMYASSGTFTGTIYCSSGTIGGWTIGTNSLYANATSTSLGVFDSVLMPGQLSFKNYSDQKTLIINPVNIAWDNGGLTKITESSITTTDLSTTDLSFVRGSNPKITWTGQLSFATDLNVHFSKTPYVDNSSDGYNGYVAKSSWVKDKFALKTSLSSYLTKSDANTSYAPKEHSHPKYTTESKVRSIVRSMVKSKYLN
ncbi:MAG: polymer-forming cytoskeletal protein, partial [Erysipelotrichaceae bacterium]|nr:polymer-forming cytoskeletal protein [Erysipelotrichaceae bacterium]